MGLSPRRFLTSRSDPASRRISAVPTCPWAHAEINAVSPVLLVAALSADLARRSLTTLHIAVTGCYDERGVVVVVTDICVTRSVVQVFHLVGVSRSRSVEQHALYL